MINLSFENNNLTSIIKNKINVKNNYLLTKKI